MGAVVTLKGFPSQGTIVAVYMVPPEPLRVRRKGERWWVGVSHALHTVSAMIATRAKWNVMCWVVSCKQHLIGGAGAWWTLGR